MRTPLFAAAALGFVLSISGAQALDARAGKAPSAAPVSASLDIQLVGHRRGPGYRSHRLGPRQIVRRLHRKGYKRIGNLRSRGDVYVVRAHGRRGVPQRLVVDAYSGQVVGRTVVGWGGRGGWGHGGWGHGGWGHGGWGRW